MRLRRLTGRWRRRKLFGSMHRVSVFRVHTGERMNRRKVLVAGGLAAMSAMAFGKNTVGVAGIAGGDVRPPAQAPAAPACALLPIEVTQRATSAPITELRIIRYWPSETSSGLARWDFDLQVFDQSGLPQWVYAWQLRRSASGLTMPSQGVRMRFPQGARLDMASTVKLAAGKAEVFNASVPNGSLMVLATARQRTGHPPQLGDLRYDAGRALLYLADGSPRDFDALLLRTS
jgi:hypothetical protein